MFFFRRGFDSQHNLLILVASCSAVFCRVVLRFFPIVLSSVESRNPVRESWFPSCSSVQQNRVHRRVECRFLPPRVIGDVGPLLWPFRSCRHCSCRCSIPGNYRTGASTTPPVARVLADPDGSSTSAIPVSVLRSSCSCLEVVSIFLFNSKTIVNLYLNAGRSIQLFHRCAVARSLHGLTVTSSGPARSVSKD